MILAYVSSACDYWSLQLRIVHKLKTSKYGFLTAILHKLVARTYILMNMLSHRNIKEQITIMLCEFFVTLIA